MNNGRAAPPTDAGALFLRYRSQQSVLLQFLA